MFRLSPELVRKIRPYPALYAAKRYHTNMHGQPMSFRDKPFLLQLYMLINQEPCHRMVVEKSVQCGLSELFLVNSHIEALNGLNIMYVLPKYESRDRFVSSRVKALYNRNEFYRLKKRELKKLEGANRLALSSFGTGIIAFVGSNVETEFLEIPVDSAYIDEKDRCHQDNLKLVPGRLTASEYKYIREISNPTAENVGIDKRYNESTKGQWRIKCDGCNHWFTPNMFLHLVEEINDGEYRVRDPNYEKYETPPSLICDKCDRPVDRLKKGVWEHEQPRKAFHGFRISQLFSVLVDLGEMLWEEDTGFFDAVKSPKGKQIFVNDRLGLPHTDSDAKVTETDLDLCQREIDYPVLPGKKNENRMLFMGVDVGKKLNVVIRERIMHQGVFSYWPYMNQGSIQFSRKLLHDLRQYKPSISV